MFYTIIQLHYKNANLYIVAVIIVRSIISKDRNRKTYLSGGNKSMLRLFERWRTELYLFHLIPIPIAKFLSSWYRAKYSSSFFLPFCLSFFFFFLSYSNHSSDGARAKWKRALRGERRRHSILRPGWRILEAKCPGPVVTTSVLLEASGGTSSRPSDSIPRILNSEDASLRRGIWLSECH